MRYKVLALTAMLLFVAAAGAVAADYVVIVNLKNPVTALPEKDVKNFYLGKKTVWDNGEHVYVLTQTASAAHIEFLRDILGKTTQQYATYWKKSVFTGTGLPPQDFDSDAAVKEAVAAQPGAIGYISASALDSSVKTLKIQ